MKTKEPKKQYLLIIVGATATGKSELAVRLAKKFNGEIISADSRQVYKGLNLGTNKITKREMRGVRHHLLNVANPIKQFSVSKFNKLARKSLLEIQQRNMLPIIVGGTGFYIDILTKKISLPNVPPNPVLRKKLEKYSIKKLFKMIELIDPDRARSLDKYNKVRLVRALEIIKVLGKVPKIKPVDTECQQVVYIGLKPNKQSLERKIKTRLLRQLPSIIRESKKLHTQGLSYKRMFELGLEYRYVSLYLQKQINLETLTEKLFIELKRYAKRQMTWFKRNEKIKWFTLSEVKGFKPDEYKKIEKYAIRVLGCSSKGD